MTLHDLAISVRSLTKSLKLIPFKKLHCHYSMHSIGREEIYNTPFYFRQARSSSTYFIEHTRIGQYRTPDRNRKVIQKRNAPLTSVHNTCCDGVFEVNKRICCCVNTYTNEGTADSHKNNQHPPNKGISVWSVNCFALITLIGFQFML